MRMNVSAFISCDSPGMDGKLEIMNMDEEVVVHPMKSVNNKSKRKTK